MNKEKEEILEKLRNIKQTAESYFKENNFDNYVVKNVIHYNKKVELVNKETGKKDEFDLYAVIAENTDLEKGGEPIFELEYLEDKEGNIVTISDLIKEYEGFENIKDVVDKTQENEEKPEEEQNKELKKDSLEELEEEKEQEENKDKKNQEIGEKKKRKPSYVIETVNPNIAKMDYWQTLKQACGLPSKVATLAFAYPVSSEDKVDHANITVYMLDKDGNIIDDLDIDDYFEFDSATGNNPTNDNVSRHEEGTKEGETQLDDHNTMIRLFAKNSKDRNTYISLEQKNGFGDYNDINAGRKAVAGTRNVEKQLETDRIRVWDSERELLMRSNAGMYHINEMADEAEEHEKHGDKKYVDIQNADGYSETKVMCQKNIYLLHQCLLKVKENEYISKNFSDENIIKTLMYNIDRNPNITQEDLIKETEKIFNNTEKNKNQEIESKHIEDNEFYKEGPWDSAKH